MKRVCVIGNSHAACWISAWKEMAPSMQQSADLTFFVVGGYEIGKLVCQGETLSIAEPEARTLLGKYSGGLEEIRLADYDVFIIISLTFGYRNLTPIFAKYGLVQDLGLIEARTVISRSCMSAAVLGVLESSLAVHIRREIGKATTKPVYLAPAPCQSEVALSSKESVFQRMAEQKGLWHLYEEFKKGAELLATRENFGILYQDPTTLVEHGGYTKAVFARGGVNSEMKTVGANDTSHMNAAFGKIAIKNALQSISAIKANKQS